MDRKTVLRRFAEQGVEVNGLIVPGRQIESTLARHALNLIVNNESDTYKVLLCGSATAVRFKGRELLLTTQHQLKGCDEKQVAMLTDNGSHIITSGGRRGYTPSSETDAYDLIAFDFYGTMQGAAGSEEALFRPPRGTARRPRDTDRGDAIGGISVCHPSLRSP